jgi:MFS family permease
VASCAIDNDAAPDARRAARRIVRTLLYAQSLGSAGFVAASTVAPLVSVQLAGTASWAGGPSAAYQAGGALVALVWGQLMDRIGRRPTLATGVAVGAAGAALASSSIVGHSLVPFLAGVSLMGMANSALQLGRFVAAEVSPPEARGRAISTVVLGGTVGAVLGPLVVGPAGSTAQRLGLDELSGPYATSTLLFLVVVALLLLRLRPEPRELALHLPALHGGGPAAAGEPRRPLREILRQREARLAVVSLVTGQAVMTMLMVITSVHMKHHDHPLPSIAFVISSHVFGMYAFSVLSGRLTDQWGRRPVIASGGAALLLSCVWATLSPRVLPLAGALLLLGLGWNLCYVAGSALLSDQLRPSERATTQGFNDLLIGAAAAIGAIASGLIFAAIGYGAMAAIGALASLLPLALALRRPPDANAGRQEGRSPRDERPSYG